MTQSHLAANAPPSRRPTHPRTAKGTKKSHIQETGLPGTKWITGAYPHPITKIDQVSTAAHLTKITPRLHLEPRLCQDYAKIMPR